MGSYTDYLENKILNHVFGAVVFIPPTNLYIGLSKTTIDDAGGNITEPAGNGYARVAVANNAVNFPTVATGVKTNGTVISFPTPSGSWGECVDFFIADAAAAGNILGYGTFAVAQHPNAGNDVEFLVDKLIITLT